MVKYVIFLLIVTVILAQNCPVTFCATCNPASNSTCLTCSAGYTLTNTNNTNNTITTTCTVTVVAAEEEAPAAEYKVNWPILPLILGIAIPLFVGLSKFIVI